MSHGWGGAPDDGWGRPPGVRNGGGPTGLARSGYGSGPISDGSLFGPPPGIAGFSDGGPPGVKPMVSSLSDPGGHSNGFGRAPGIGFHNSGSVRHPDSREREELDEPDRDLGKRVQGQRQLNDAYDEIRVEGDIEQLYTSALTFEDMGLSEDVKKGLYCKMNFERPSAIQAKTIPLICTPPYNSLVAQAQNGCGKTTCFAICILHRIDTSQHKPQAIVVVPTRELAIQNEIVLQRMGEYCKVTTISTSQTDEVHRKAEVIDRHVIVGTHGSLAIWRRRRWLILNFLKVLVLDEADEMLKAGSFADDTYRMIKEVKGVVAKLQILMFSATYPPQIKAFADRLCPGANKVYVPTQELSLDKIKQYRVYCASFQDKIFVLQHLLFPQCEKLGAAIIFVRYRHTARYVHKVLTDDGYKVTAISGEMSFAERDEVIEEFRNGVTTFLIATDVLSRGFDVENVTLVVNFDIPVEKDMTSPSMESYIHRVGRTGRFRRRGAAFNLVALGSEEEHRLDQIARYFERNIPEVPTEEEAFTKVLKEAGLTEG
ncbi:unnamed protein product [Ostreobium quekettii]|uniref:RNA helicase n=1 Tax=Ostreobium quekettii TaxID=121088 RepID=A0A8S1JAW5_9CHLO|nr:unnamed protein product [Ostreobium quekettii]|eukprot:evm.model.scf_1749.2 EVM.evm.TU.scf_1749.2   scf_1749:23034-29982(+)